MSKGKQYGGDPAVYQMRDMNRRITSLEKALIRAETRIRLLQSRQTVLDDYSKVTRAIAGHLEERIS